MFGHVGSHMVGQRSAVMPHRLEQVLGLALDLRVIVVALAHFLAQFVVGPAGFFRRGRLLVQPPFELMLEPHQRFEHFRGQPRADAHRGQLRVRFRKDAARFDSRKSGFMQASSSTSFEPGGVRRASE